MFYGLKMDNKYDVRLKHPFTCMVAGPTSSGKTEFVKKLIKYRDKLIDPVPGRIVWHGDGNEAEDVDAEYFSGLPDDVSDLPNDSLVILDDLMTRVDRRIITSLFTKDSHHKKLSVIYVVQNLFEKDHRTISLNTQYLVIFKNPRDASQITNLAKQMYPGETNVLTQAFRNASSRPHGYLFVDYKQDTSEEVRLRTNILPGEEDQIVYVKRK